MLPLKQTLKKVNYFRGGIFRLVKKHTAKELEQFIELYLDGVPFRELRSEYGLKISPGAFNMYFLNYKANGPSALEDRDGFNTYTKEFKEKVVKEFLESKTYLRVIARKYKIPSARTVRNWIIKYTNGEATKAYDPKPEVYTMKYRKTTHEERILIVKDCIQNQLNYKETAQKYNISYNLVYQWVKKYQKYGPDGLVDSRGKRKPDNIQTETERIRAEMAILKARNEYLETENAALKKLQEVESELMFAKRDLKRNIKRLKN